MKPAQRPSAGDSQGPLKVQHQARGPLLTPRGYVSPSPITQTPPSSECQEKSEEFEQPSQSIDLNLRRLLKLWDQTEH